ncbi:hypothetical protein M430DRAFT_113475, partial [Amorphotheca resinae ATCC 22711]
MDHVKWFKKTVAANQSDTQKSDEAAYSHLLQSSDDDSTFENEKGIVEQAQTAKARRLNRFFVLFSKSVLIIFALWGVFNIGRYSVRAIWPKKPVSCSCGGTTVVEAKARGCIFTPLAIAWLPPQCLDMELADEFDQIGPEGGWPYYADLNGTIPLTREEVGAIADIPGGVFYTTQEWHIMHCMYTWRKHYRSKFTGVTIEQRSNGLKHIHHC